MISYNAFLFLRLVANGWQYEKLGILKHQSFNLYAGYLMLQYSYLALSA